MATVAINEMVVFIVLGVLDLVVSAVIGQTDLKSSTSHQTNQA